MALTRDEIIAAIAARKTVTKDEDVPEWGGVVKIRLLSAAELKAIGFFSGTDAADLPVNILVAALSDEQGEPLFTKADFKTIAQADFATTIRIFEVASKFNGLTEEEVAAAAESFVEAQDEDGSSS